MAAPTERIGSVFIVMGFTTFAIGLVADLIYFNRQLLEMILARLKGTGVNPR